MIDTSVSVQTYADPLIWPERGWRDVYAYDADGRTRADGAEARFSAHGHLVLEEDAAGRPARAVAYPVSTAPDGGLTVTETPLPGQYRYRYQGPDDLIGIPVPGP